MGEVGRATIYAIKEIVSFLVYEKFKSLKKIIRISKKHQNL